MFVNANDMRGYGRPFINKQGQKVVLNAQGKPIHSNAAVLGYNDWQELDEVKLDVYNQHLSAVQDLFDNNLIHRLTGGLGSVTSMYQRVSGMSDANVSMEAQTAGEKDLVLQDQVSTPIPIINKDFDIGERQLLASRRNGEGLDTTNGRAAMVVVAEMSERLLIGTAQPVVLNGATIYGYTNHPDRAQIDMTTAWTNNTVAGEDIVEQVNAMLQAARNRRVRGKFNLYIPTAYEYRMDEDYRAAGDSRTLRQRIEALDGIQTVRSTDMLPADNVVLVHMSKTTVDLAVAAEPTTLQDEGRFGSVIHMRHFAAWAPRVKSDFDGRTGIVHLRPQP